MRRPALYTHTVAPLLVEGGTAERAEVEWLLGGCSGEIAEMLRRIDAEDLVLVEAGGELVSWQ